MGFTEANEENDLLKRIFGMLQDKVRIYQILEDREVMRDEFIYCQIMYQIVFGDKGFADTLGPTWRMIHDPRFVEIENLMVVDRKAIFGGDARLGKQHIMDDGSFSSTVSDLEKYAEILGEGRNFHNVLVHPDKNCQERLWLERIYRGFTHIKPHSDFGCTCTGKATEPSTFWNAPGEDVTALLKQECPNRAFNQDGSMNAYGKLMYSLIRVNLIGLIHDYAETPLIDSYVYLRDNGVVQDSIAESVAFMDPHGQDAPRVLQEIDILEQALTHRATMRVTAFKLLKKIGFEKKLAALTGDKFELTDVERDELLRIVYESDYPEQHPEVTFRIRLNGWEKDVEQKLLDYVGEIRGTDFTNRQSAQLEFQQNQSHDTIYGLKHGTILPINSYTEPSVEIPADVAEDDVMKYAAMMEAIMGNEFKQELYLVMVQAEADNNTAVVDILTPIFLTPDYELDEPKFYQILESIRIGSKSLRAERMSAIRGTKQTTDNKKKPLQELEGEFHSKDNPGGMFR